VISRSSSTVVSLLVWSGARWVGVGVVRDTSGGTYPGTTAVAAYAIFLPTASISKSNGL